MIRWRLEKKEEGEKRKECPPRWRNTFWLKADPFRFAYVLLFESTMVPSFSVFGQTFWILRIFMSNSMDLNFSKLPEIAKDREAWWAAVQGAEKSQTQLSNWTTANNELFLPEQASFLSFASTLSYLFCTHGDTPGFSPIVISAFRWMRCQGCVVQAQWMLFKRRDKG